MTNDDGRKPEGAPERSPKLAQAPLRALMGMARSAFPFNERWRSWRLLRGEPLELWPGRRMSRSPG